MEKTSEHQLLLLSIHPWWSRLKGAEEATSHLALAASRLHEDLSISQRICGMMFHCTGAAWLFPCSLPSLHTPASLGVPLHGFCTGLSSWPLSRWFLCREAARGGRAKNLVQVPVPLGFTPRAGRGPSAQAGLWRNSQGVSHPFLNINEFFGKTGKAPGPLTAQEACESLLVDLHMIAISPRALVH